MSGIVKKKEKTIAHVIYVHIAVIPALIFCCIVSFLLRTDLIFFVLVLYLTVKLSAFVVVLFYLLCQQLSMGK